MNVPRLPAGESANFCTRHKSHVPASFFIQLPRSAIVSMAFSIAGMALAFPT